MIKTSESLIAISKALNALQGTILAAKADSTNPFFKSHYADLESIWMALREPLVKQGLSIVQLTSHEDGMGWFVVTRILHSSGEWLEGYFPIVAAKERDPQAFGSAVSYARRYSLAAAVGIYQTDDDAETAMNRQAPKQSIPAPPPSGSASKQNPPQTLFDNKAIPRIGECPDCGSKMTRSKTAGGKDYCYPCWKSKKDNEKKSDDIPF